MRYCGTQLFKISIFCLSFSVCLKVKRFSCWCSFKCHHDRLPFKASIPDCGTVCSTLHRSTNAAGRSPLSPMTSIAASCTAEQLQEAAAGIVSSVAWSIPRKSTNLQRRSHWMPAFKLPHWTECRHRELRNNLSSLILKKHQLIFIIRYHL